MRAHAVFGALAVAFAAAAGPALAVDGVIEINQVRALAGGVTPSDTAGFPVSIDTTGSYRLTGDLTVPDASTTAIAVSADNVTIDLNGFSIQGVTVCSGDPLACAPSGAGMGINAVSTSAENVTVMNGTVRGMGNAGIALSKQGRVLNVRAIGNAGNGVNLTGGSATARDNTAYQNGLKGIAVNGNSTVTGNTANYNGDDGIYASNGNSTISGNTANYNGDDGIDAVSANGCTVTGNTVSNNGGDGITAAGTAASNTATSNGGYGLYMPGGGYVGNVMRLNTSGSVTGLGVEIGTNLCDTNTTCP